MSHDADPAAIAAVPVKLGGKPGVAVPAGRENRIASYEVCDFNLPIAADALLSRGMMGDGVIDFATIGTWVRDAGYTGDIEVEIFNQGIWDADGDTVLATMKERYADLVLPFA